MPNLHPFLTHFPIALFTATLVFDGISILVKNHSFERIGWWTMLLGTLGLVGSIITGLLAKGSIHISPPSSAVLEMHEQIAFVIAAIATCSLLWRISARTHLPQRRAIYFMVITALVVFTWVGAWYGGELVYRYGVGVQMLSR